MTNAELYCRDLWAKIVRHRDRYCLLCGATSNLEAHHLFPKAQGNWVIIYDVDFGVTLCNALGNGCHTDTPRGSEKLEKIIAQVRARNEERAEKILTRLNKPIKPCPIPFNPEAVKMELKRQWREIQKLSWTDDDCFPSYGDANFQGL